MSGTRLWVHVWAIEVSGRYEVSIRGSALDKMLRVWVVGAPLVLCMRCNQILSKCRRTATTPILSVKPKHYL